MSARDAASVPSPHPGPVLSRASHPRPAEESNELSGVGPAAQSNLGPNGLGLTRARGRGGLGTAGPLPAASVGRRRGVT